MSSLKWFLFHNNSSRSRNRFSRCKCKWCWCCGCYCTRDPPSGPSGGAYHFTVLYRLVQLSKCCIPMASSFVVRRSCSYCVCVCVSLMGGPYRTYQRTAGSWACVKTNATCYKALAHSLSLSPFLVLHMSMLLFPPLQVSELLPLSLTAYSSRHCF